MSSKLPVSTIGWEDRNKIFLHMDPEVRKVVELSTDRDNNVSLASSTNSFKLYEEISNCNP